MSGERDLSVILDSLNPRMSEEEYVFCSVSEDEMFRIGCEVHCVCREDENITVVLPVDKAVLAGFEYAFPSRMITISLHTSLDAVGLLAKLLTRLAEAGIAVNVMSGVYHDHLFVPVDRAEDAMCILREWD